MMHFTVLGAGGYVGHALVTHLERCGHIVHGVTRASLPALLATHRSAGHVIDCIGLTGDFRVRRQDTAEAHVGITAHCLSTLQCESFLFLSSTRVYARATVTTEGAPLLCMPTEPSDLYNITKLAGESLCLSDPRPTVRVVRLSNVYGPNMGTDTFLGQVLQEGLATGGVQFRQAAASAKDYVALDEVLRMLPRLATRGEQRLYNLAAGHNTAHGELAAVLQDAFGWQTGFQTEAPRIAFPVIDITRITAEFGAALSDLSADIRILLPFAERGQCSRSMRSAIG